MFRRAPASSFMWGADGSECSTTTSRTGPSRFRTPRSTRLAAGEGLAKRWCKALDAFRERGVTVRPVCSFVRHYIDKHPEYHDLVVKEG